MGTADDASTGQAGGLTIPPAAKQDFPELVELIVHSESMNDEERQYWLNILPVMTPEQRKSLEEILLNEKRQLAAIDAKYKTSATSTIDATKRQEQLKQRKQAETADQAKESDTEDEILKSIQQL